MKTTAVRALAAALVAGSCLAQQGTPRDPAQDEERPAPKEARWPELERAQAQRVEHLCKSLRRAVKPEVRDRIEGELTAVGAGAAPLLLPRLSDHRVNINPSLVRVLDAVTTAEHAPLLARSATDQKQVVRSYVLARLTSFRLPEMAPVFRAARGDRDPEVAFQAALGLASAGDLGGMADIFDRCQADWQGLAARVGPALQGARGPAATHWVLDRMAKGDERARVTGLRLLRSLATAEAAGRIAVHLDSESHNVKKEAINALRAVVDGAEPLEQLSVFQAIEMAKQWQARVR